MREIKFRVFVDGHMIIVDGASSYTLTFGNEKPVLSMFSNGGEFVCDHEVEHVMQYTGLNDRNGKDIYEGDIVRHESGTVTKVIFDGGCFGIETAHGIAPLQIRNAIHIVEVIGNIHENPELVKT